MKGAVVVPARYNSTRFPGKPLATIDGAPMIWHVWKKCCDAVDRSQIFIATCDDAIRDVCNGFGANVVWTSPDCMTGTDRVAEVVQQIGLAYAVNVQGDEPMVSPEDIRQVYELMEADSSAVMNCYAPIEQHEILDPTVPKVVVSKSDRLLYMSRGGIPYDKSATPRSIYKQVSIYGFSSFHLQQFTAVKKKTPLEQYEDIEVLRFLELDVPVTMIRVSSGTIAVDTPEDLLVVQKLMAEE